MEGYTKIAKIPVGAIRLNPAAELLYMGRTGKIPYVITNEEGLQEMKFIGKETTTENYITEKTLINNNTERIVLEVPKGTKINIVLESE